MSTPTPKAAMNARFKVKPCKLPQHAEITCEGNLGGRSILAAAKMTWTVAKVYGQPAEDGPALAQRIVDLLNRSEQP